MVLCVAIESEWGENICQRPGSGNAIKHYGLERQKSRNVRISIVCRQSEGAKACNGPEEKGSSFILTRLHGSSQGSPHDRSQANRSFTQFSDFGQGSQRINKLHNGT